MVFSVIPEIWLLLLQPLQFVCWSIRPYLLCSLTKPPGLLAIRDPESLQAWQRRVRFGCQSQGEVGLRILTMPQRF